MPKHLPPAEITISKEHARRFLLAHHRLLPPRRLKGKQGILDYIRHVNCIQYDPINVVGNNSHLVLQSRVSGYKPEMLREALYEDRSLLDGWDKVMSIYPAEDWPYFARHRKRMPLDYANDLRGRKAYDLMKTMNREIEKRGPLSSLDIEHDERVSWWLGNARVARIALDVLFYSGETVVHHRVGTRRYFELAKRVLPKELYSTKNPHPSVKAYQDWHIYRRVGSLGIARPGGGGERWGGMLRTTGGEQRAALKRLTERGELARLGVEGFESVELFVRRSDLAELEAGGQRPGGRKKAAFLAALDNSMWDRDLIDKLFDFYYRWEVYTPEPKRVWGYYVLPVLYGDQLVARFDPAYDKANGVFTIQNWWWQKGVDKKDDEMLDALKDNLRAFTRYLGAKDVNVGAKIKKDQVIKEMVRGI